MCNTGFLFIMLVFSLYFNINQPSLDFLFILDRVTSPTRSSTRITSEIPKLWWPTDIWGNIGWNLSKIFSKKFLTSTHIPPGTTGDHKLVTSDPVITSYFQGKICMHNWWPTGAKLSLEARYYPQRVFPPLKLLCYSWPWWGSLTFVANNTTTGYQFWLICIRCMWFHFRIGQNGIGKNAF